MLEFRGNLSNLPRVSLPAMTLRRLASLVLAGAALFLAGCQTVDSRIKENPELFAKLPTDVQAKVKQGIIDLGFDEDTVYLALGAPDQKREQRSAKGDTTVWIYNTYFERYDGTRFAGYARRVYYDPVVKAWRYFYQPVYADTYRSETEERIRVTFENGKVTVIEQTKG